MVKIKKIFIALSLIVPMLASCGGTTDSTEPPASSGDTSHSDEGSGSSSEGQGLDKTKLLQNLAGMTNYKLDMVNSYSFTDDRYGQGFDISVSFNSTNSLEVDGDNYSSHVVDKMTTSIKISEIAEAMEMSVADVIAMYSEMEDWTVDVANDTVTSVSPDEIDNSKYKLDTANNQYMELSYDDEWKFIDGYFTGETKDDGTIKCYRELIKKIIKDGTVKEDNNTIEYTFTAEDKANKDFYYGTEGLSAAITTTAATIKDNYPEKVTLNFDVAKVAEIIGQPFTAFGLELNFKSRGDATPNIPDGTVKCNYHEYSNGYVMDEDGHVPLCNECYMYLGEREAHTYNPVHKVCTICGYVKGLDRYGEYEFNSDHLLATNSTKGTKLYAFKYHASEAGDYYNLEMFAVVDSETNKITYESYDDYEQIGGTLYYSVNDHFAIVQVTPSQYVTLGDNVCQELSKTTYKVYKNLTITMNEDVPYVDSVTLEDYLASNDPSFTVAGYNNHRSSHSGTFTRTVIDACHTRVVDHCDKCDRDYHYNVEVLHGHITFTAGTFADFTSIGGSYRNRYPMNFENHVVLRGTCSYCNESFVAVIETDALPLDHTSQLFGYDLYYRPSLHTLLISYASTIPHIDDGTGHCILCGEALA